MHPHLLRLLVLIPSLVATVALHGQGSLIPPSSPAPTMKTLDQLEPRTIVNMANTPGDAKNSFIIRAPGSYYLTGNIAGEADKHGISIQANDVTLDLNGFALIGGGGPTRGVNVPAAQSNFSIRNGSVRGWLNGGVRADAAVMLAEKLVLASNTGANGLFAGNGSMVRDCIASGNYAGFSSNDRAQFSNCISTENSGPGFSCTSFVTIIDCTSSRNADSGIIVLSGSSVLRCNASRNDADGIVAVKACNVADCTAGNNGRSGIVVTEGSQVRNCIASSNTSNGIETHDDCRVVGNSCDLNHAAGIKCTVSNPLRGAYVDDNSCTANAYGIDAAVDGGYSVIVRNRVSRNTVFHYGIGPNVVMGPQVVWGIDRVISTTSPWANIAN